MKFLSYFGIALSTIGIIGIYGDSVFSHWQTWVIIFGMALSQTGITYYYRTKERYE